MEMSQALQTYRDGIADVCTRHYKQCPDLAAVIRLSRRIPGNTLRSQIKSEIRHRVARQMYPNKSDAFAYLQRLLGISREAITAVLNRKTH